MISGINVANLNRVPETNPMLKRLVECMSKKCLEGKKHNIPRGEIKRNTAGEIKIYGTCFVCKEYHIEDPTNEQKREYEQEERRISDSIFA